MTIEEKKMSSDLLPLPPWMNDCESDSSEMENLWSDSAGSEDEMELTCRNSPNKSHVKQHPPRPFNPVALVLLCSPPSSPAVMEPMVSKGFLASMNEPRPEIVGTKRKHTQLFYPVPPIRKLAATPQYSTAKIVPRKVQCTRRVALNINIS